MSYILIIIGFILLVKGADYFVEGSSNLAKSLRIPTLIIGLTIVALGTSAPEVIISSIASLRNSNDISISNIIGSNMFNLLVVLGASSIYNQLKIKKQILTRDFIISIATTIVMLIFMCDISFNNSNYNIISSSEGLVLLLGFIIYLYIMILFTKKDAYIIKEYHVLDKVDILMLLSGLLAVVLGGELVVRSARLIAINLGVSETLIGLTIISIGTSLPELITSLIAAKKGKIDIAIGNVLGSNIYNILLVLGISSFISPIPINSYAVIDCIILLSVSVLLFILSVFKRKIDSKAGIFMLTNYLLFMIYIMYR